ncbi:hypothetical protein B2J93_9546 [Marssonina coronariae]|uniref:Uncharacterized protein n=1 Tax=Diplocarpon coronariae TaxID=2795749 RepID=A0A218Z7W3_9HELO|nr:hypothetical protein B2J93_9546 [Marssonina coronariae]
MSAKLEDRKTGYLIAIEGDTDVISTQLRLLPPSPKIMVLPDFLEGSSSTNENGAFDARAHVRYIQRALFQRTETARSFIQSSTPTHPRLVFAIHGSVSARAHCITRISQKITNGNFWEAETIFNNIVQGGIAGLMEDVAVEEAPVPETDKFDKALGNTSIESMQWEGSSDRDVVLRKVPTRPNLAHFCASSAMRRMQKSTQKNEDICEASHGISTDADNEQIVQTVLTVPSRSMAAFRDRRMTFGDAQHDQYSQHLLDRIQDVDTDWDLFYDANKATGGEDSIMSAPITPAVTYGQACLVDIQPSSPIKLVRRARSFDGFSSINSRFLKSTSIPQALKQPASYHHFSERSQSAAVTQTESNEKDRFTALPRTTFLEALETTIIRSPTSTRSTRSWNSLSASKEIPNRAVYVDRGTGADEAVVTDSKTMPFVPVFELVEDMVIQFTDDSPNYIFESVVQSYKNGSYPILPVTPGTSASTYSPSLVGVDEGYDPEFSTRSISSLQLVNDPDIRPNSCLSTLSVEIVYDRRQEYDPYAIESYSSDIQRQCPPKFYPGIPANVESASSPTSEKPLSYTTEAETSSLSKTKYIKEEIATRFVNFAPVNPQNAISTQNSFRHLLNVYFPSHDKYSQFYYQVAPEAERLWKPVFRNDENVSTEHEVGSVDQIIAFGSEDGVKRDFFLQVSGQIEKLGSNRAGLNISGKLEIRYLISNVMQSHCNVPPADQSINYLSNPDVLAALIVPQIEAFLASNTSTRLLILHYTAADLPTIFALRKLLGFNLVKIAGILDSLASDPPSMSRSGTYMSSRPRAPISSRPSNRSISSSQSDTTTKNRQMPATASLAKNSFQLPSNIHEPTASFAKADFLLPSTATNIEIATFLSGIWKYLVEKSAFYATQPEPKPIISEQPPSSPTPASPPRFRDRDSGYPASKVSRLASGARSSISSDTTRGNSEGAGSATLMATIRHKYTASITSIKTTTTTQTDRKEDKEWENFYIGEEDSDDDEFDRMIMGRKMRNILPEASQVGQERNTKKALKWLGLA